MPRLTTKDALLHYQCMGEGEDVVLIHGLGANLAFWYMGIAKVLSRTHRVILYDLRGHGRSSTPLCGYSLADMTADLGALLDHLNVARVHLVGHSFGARVALSYAISNSNRLASLIVADTQLKALQPPVRLRDWSHWPNWKAQLQQQGFRHLPDDDEYITFRLLGHFNQLGPELGKGMPRQAPLRHRSLTPYKQIGRKHMQTVPRRARVRRPSLRRRDMGLRGASRWEDLLSNTTAREELDQEQQLTAPALRSIAVPTLAVYGEYSHCLPCCWSLRELLPDCRVVIVPRAGHFHPVIRPRLFSGLVRRFLKRQTSETRSLVANDITSSPALAQPLVSYEPGN